MKTKFKLTLIKVLVFSITFIMGAAISFSLTGFQDEKPQVLKVELPIGGWDIVLDVVEQSNAPYQRVTSVKEALINQLTPQIQPVIPVDTTSNP